MGSPGSVPPPGFKQLAVHLVDCMRTPADRRPAATREPEETSDDLSDLPLRELSVHLVDCMRTPGLNGQILHQSYPSAKGELKERDGQLEMNDGYFENPRQVNMINLELDQQPRWLHTDLGAEVNLYKEEEEEASECDDGDPSWEESEAKEPDELGLSHTAEVDGTLLVFQGEGGSGGVMWLIQDHELSESLKSAALRDASSDLEALQGEACCESQQTQKRGPSGNIAEQRGAEDVGVSEPGATERNLQETLSEPRSQRCEHCGKSFARRSNVIRHQRHHCSITRGTVRQPGQTEQETYSCNKCSWTFRTKRHWKLHACVHKENTKTPEGKETLVEAPRERCHTCTQCNKSFYLLHTLRQHLLTHTGEKSFSCKVCGKQFGREGTLKEHQLIHTKEKPFKCEQCGKTCARRGDLKIHMLSHSEERPYGCSYCTKSFKQRVKLKQHERIHTGEKPYQCELCSKRFRIQVSLTAHQYTHTGEKPFKCSLCPKAFSVRNNLKKHQMLHTGEKPYSCSYCGKSCRLLQHLIIHERGHTGEKPYTCDKCGKGYSHPSALKSHQSSHKEKPPCCSLCGQEFRELAELTIHECAKTAEKPYRCPQCGKCFSQAVNLKKHQVIHSGEKPYDCKDCGKQFNHKSNLTKHIRIHTGEKPFECEHCKRCFRLLQHLTNHRLTHNKKETLDQRL